MATAPAYDARGGRVRVIFSRFRVAQTSGEVYLKQNLMRKLILRSICLQLSRNLTKTSKNFAKFPTIFFQFFIFFDDFFFAESIRMYPNVSEYVKTSPKRPENVEKLRENVEKLRERLLQINSFVCAANLSPKNLIPVR